MHGAGHSWLQHARLQCDVVPARRCRGGRRYKEGQVIACLREYKPQLSKRCKAQLNKVQKDVS